MFFSYLSLKSSVRCLYRKQKRHPERNASYSLNLCPHGNTPRRDGNISPRFHPACFPWKTCLIHAMITESPCRIKAAPRWSSVSRNTKALPPLGLLSEMTRQPTVLFNAFILHRLFYISQEGCVKTVSLCGSRFPQPPVLMKPPAPQ